MCYRRWQHAMTSRLPLRRPGLLLLEAPRLPVGDCALEPTLELACDPALELDTGIRDFLWWEGDDGGVRVDESRVLCSEQLTHFHELPLTYHA